MWPLLRQRDALQRRRRARPRGRSVGARVDHAGVIYPPPQADPAGGAAGRARRRRARAAGVRRALQRQRLRRPGGRGRSGRARDQRRHRRRGGAERRGARAARRAGRFARGRRRASAPWRTGCRARRRLRRPLPAGRRPPAGLHATAARPTCWPRSPTTRRARARASRRRLRATPGVTLGGGAIAGPQVGDQVSADIARAELIAFPILFLLSLLVFRSAVSALLPLVVGGTTILLTFLFIRFVHTQRQPDVDLRPEPDQRARAGAGDRLLAVHGQPLPGGAGRRPVDRGGAQRHPAHRGAHGRLFGRSRCPPRWPRC